MSDYTKLTSYDTKDALSTGDPLKRVKGTELDDEFDAISVAIATKSNSASPAFTGTPTGPTASAGTNNTQLATTAFVNALFPTGIIAMWSGTIVNIPAGWNLCNGSNGTPDLRNKFIIGAYLDDTVAKTTVTGSNTQTGGSKDAIAVTHNHTLTDSGHVHSVNITAVPGFGFVQGNDTATSSVGSRNTGSATTGISIASAGESGTNQNLPPYYALAFIMKA